MANVPEKRVIQPKKSAQQVKLWVQLSILKSEAPCLHDLPQNVSGKPNQAMCLGNFIRDPMVLGCL